MDSTILVTYYFVVVFTACRTDWQYLWLQMLFILFTGAGVVRDSKQHCTFKHNKEYLWRYIFNVHSASLILNFKYIFTLPFDDQCKWQLCFVHELCAFVSVHTHTYVYVSGFSVLHFLFSKSFQSILSFWL
jgi:hypothetical protein